MARGYGESRARGKGAARILNMSRLGGPRRKLSLKTDMMSEHMPHGSFKRAAKSGPHKKV